MCCLLAALAFGQGSSTSYNNFGPNINFILRELYIADYCSSPGVHCEGDLTHDLEFVKFLMDSQYGVYPGGNGPPLSVNGASASTVGASLGAPGTSGHAVKPHAAQSASLPVAGQAAQGIAVGLFTSDGVPDTAVVTPQAGITVNLFNADGTVRSTKTYPLPQAELGTVAADFNDDGNIDLAVIQDSAVPGPGSVAILLGHGDGTFGPAMNFPAGPEPISIALGDFNGDGKLDLAVGNSGGNVDILIGKGDGTFAAPVTYNVTQNPVSMVAVDINGDGNIDLAIVNGECSGSVDQLEVLLGNGEGNFKPLPALFTGTSCGDLAYTDLNHDGKLDLLIVDPASSAIVTLFGNGDGTFQSPQFSLAAAGAGSLALMPLEDGNTAIMVADQISGNLFNMFANSAGTIETPPLQTLGTYPDGIAAADLNGDQQADLVVTDSQAGSVYVLLNTGQGQFGKPATYPVGPQPGAVAIADLNHDGKPDVVAADSGGIDVLLGKGNGALGAFKTFSSSAPLSSLALADFNADGNLDVASAVPSNGALALFTGNGDGTFQPANTISLPGSVVPYTVVSGDFNGDGKPDLAVAYNQPLPPGVTTTTPPGGVYILLGKGNGAFSTPANIVLPGSVLPEFVAGGFNAADVNGDGKLDLVVAFQTANGNQVAALLGKGDGTFQMATPTATLTGAATIVITDLNGDGKPDLVLGDCCGLTEASYMLGNGDGTFQPEVQFPSGPSPGAIAAADFNGDGQPDLAIAGLIQMPNRGTLSLLFNSFPKIEAATVVSAANSAAAAIAPGSLATAFGADLANQEAGGAPLPLPTAFGGTSVSILDSSGTTSLAPLLYVIPTQVNFEVPAGVATGAAQATVVSGDGTQSIAKVQIAAVAPGLFEADSSGLAAGYVVLYHSDNTQTTEQLFTLTSSGAVVATPVSLGSSTDRAFLFLFGTGIEAAGASGVNVTVAGTNAPVSYAGPQGQFIGVDQVNVQLPASLKGSGNVTLKLTANGIAANPVNITIQ
jgi:uncharacterized protein (TIGR03437 family)